MKNFNQFDETLINCVMSFDDYYDIFYSLFISSINWKIKLPTIDTRYLELNLFENGLCVVFEDEIYGITNLPCIVEQFDLHGNPYKVRAYSTFTSYNRSLSRDSDKFVICYDNMKRTPPFNKIFTYAKILSEIDNIISVNVNSQKTPVIALGDKKDILSLKNIFMKFTGNQKFIAVDNNFDKNSITTLNLESPYVADKLYELKMKYWHECLNFIGIANLLVDKKERMIKDEVQTSIQGAISMRERRLKPRKIFCNEMKETFNIDCSVDFYDSENNENVSRETISENKNESVVSENVNDNNSL